MNNSHRYRPDIDGLRAFAVLAVLFFHARLGCPGGYVGVDIFFVISGFLITSLILADIKEGAFTLAGFWERRIRRIVPALTTVILATFVAGWMILWPEEFKTFGGSVMWQSLLVSNIYFWRTEDYFSPLAAATPLLHTWSLAVEEQFYLLFPLLLLFLARFPAVSLRATISGLCLGSLALSAVGVYVARQPTYYLLPTRACELMVGAILACSSTGLDKAWMRESAGLLGLGLIIWPVFFYSAGTRFPGLAVIPPCLGAALIIYSSNEGLSSTGRLLAWRPLVFIGLISYSLYLWHWPILTMANSLADFWGKPPPAWSVRLGLLLVAALLAAFSWKFIETPFRQRKIFARRRSVFIFAMGSQLALLLCGAGVYYDNGVDSRLLPKAAYYYDFRRDFTFRNEITANRAVAGDFAELGAQSTNRPVNLLLWGDSHAMSLAPVLDALCQRYSIRGMAATHSRTAPFSGCVQPGTWLAMQDTRIFQQATADFIIQKHVKVVIIAARWDSYGLPDVVAPKLAATVRALRAAGSDVYVLKDVPDAHFDVPETAARAVYQGNDPAKLKFPIAQYDAENQTYEPVFTQARAAGAVVLDPSPFFSNGAGCYDVIRNDKLLYWDGNHLTVEGSMLLAPLFEPLFKPGK